MPRYRFPGYSIFLQDAARRIGRPEAVAPARRIALLGALGNLCGQASASAPAHVPAIMAKVSELRDQLHAAHEAANLMIADVNRAFGLDAKPRRKGRPSRSGRGATPEANQK